MSRPTNLVTFGRRCISFSRVALRSHVAKDMLTRRSSLYERIDALGVNNISGTRH